MRLAVATLLSFTLVATSHADEHPSFAYETTQLTADDIRTFPDIGPATGSPKTEAECRAFPGTTDWPTEVEWRQLNASLGGALLHPVPAAAACYPGAYQDDSKCAALVASQLITRAHFEDPLALSTQWPAGNPCPVAAQPTGNCTQGGLPVYVVNATSVRQIQMAVNFARNKNLRLVVKNTGHDFVGRSTGAGALSIWTLHLKGFELLPGHIQGSIQGDAAHVAAGLETWEVHEAMGVHNVAMVAPSFSTVGPFGGYMAGGGHSALVSYYGLGSDQVLALNVVTADGSFVRASETENSDLFFALRGGGGGTYGIVTSAVVKAHPAVNITTTNLALSSLTTPIDLFWKAMEIYHAFGGVIVDAGGKDSTYITPLLNNTAFNFTTQIDFPNRPAAAVLTLLGPLEAAFRSAGLNLTFPPPTIGAWAASVLGEGAPIRDQRFASRLMPRAVWDDPAKFAVAMAAQRRIVEEGGYQVHGTHMAPSVKIAGHPGKKSGVNPAFRTAVMHLVVYDYVPSAGSTGPGDREARARLSRYTDYLRNATPGSGAYINEADVLEPNWQQSFFGDQYRKLQKIKSKWDPSGLFWAPTTVGSEAWAVRTADGKPTQDGRLCRAGGRH